MTDRSHEAVGPNEPGGNGLAFVQRRRHLSLVTTMPFISESRSWRESPHFVDEVVSLERHIARARAAEAAKLDAVFYVDFIGLNRTAIAANPAVPFEPMTVMGAIAATTSKIGLIGTASTMYNYPFNVARQFASIDQLSGGRSGWNVVTSFSAEKSFGLEALPAPAERYARAQEFLDAVIALWQSWQPDAVVADARSGVWADVSRIHDVRVDGEYITLDAALDVPRSPQGHPVVFQAGASAEGIAFAGRNAEAIFAATPVFTIAQEYYAATKAAAVGAGRAAESVIVLPGVHVYLGATDAEAWGSARAAAVTEHRITSILKDLEVEFPELDLSGLAPDAPIPPERFPSRERVEKWGGRRSRIEVYRRLAFDGAPTRPPTYRQFLERSAISGPHAAFIGTVQSVADEMERWFRGGAADGFTLIGGDSVAELDRELLPELRRRDLFRTDYEGSTLRSHFALPAS
ncbi:MAG: class flavin-dependent oxidoreductase [Subtercola sp.]|nr:class flavin-dependent oxidoreductase [Subtercola sp.]